MQKIASIYAREILDSRGHPTVEADVVTNKGVTGRAAVPSGASTGTMEAVELRDKDLGRYAGKGVLKAVANINTIIAPAMHGRRIDDQQRLDEELIKLDATNNKSRLGANAILAVSLACAKAASKSLEMEFYQYISKISGSEPSLPMPMINVLNGGVHANNNLAFQEFMVIPASAKSMAEAVRMGAGIFHCLVALLKKKKMHTTVGDEGGVAPDIDDYNVALEFLDQAVMNAGYLSGKDVFFAIDMASSEFFQEKSYALTPGEKYTSLQFVEKLEQLCGDWPVASIEDPMAEDDWDGWKHLMGRLGKHVQIVGDDLFVTNTTILTRGIAENAANSILIKPNQIGTLSETISAIHMARAAEMNCIMSHRSGETEDVSIADIAVGTGCGQIKTGSLCRSERVAKYNRLLRIEEKLPERYFGTQVLQKFAWIFDH